MLVKGSPGVIRISSMYSMWNLGIIHMSIIQYFPFTLFYMSVNFYCNMDVLWHYLFLNIHFFIRVNKEQPFIISSWCTVIRRIAFKVFDHNCVVEILGTHYSDAIMGAMVSQITSLTIVYSTVYPGADQRIQRWPVNSPHRWLVA